MYISRLKDSQVASSIDNGEYVLVGDHMPKASPTSRLNFNSGHYYINSMDDIRSNKGDQGLSNRNSQDSQQNPL